MPSRANAIELKVEAIILGNLNRQTGKREITETKKYDAIVLPKSNMTSSLRDALGDMFDKVKLKVIIEKGLKFDESKEILLIDSQYYEIIYQANYGDEAVILALKEYTSKL